MDCDCWWLLDCEFLVGFIRRHGDGIFYTDVRAKKV